MKNNINGVLKFKTATPNVGDVIQIPGSGNFVWELRRPDDLCTGHWRKLSKREWDEYSSCME